MKFLLLICYIFNKTIVYLFNKTFWCTRSPCLPSSWKHFTSIL